MGPLRGLPPRLLAWGPPAGAGSLAATLWGWAQDFWGESSLHSPSPIFLLQTHVSNPLSGPSPPPPAPSHFLSEALTRMWNSLGDPQSL